MKNWNDYEPKTQIRIVQAVLVAFFLILSIPFIIWAIQGDANSSDSLRLAAWLLPVVGVGLGFIVTLIWLIYNAAKK
jgi:hypothetical protein